MDVRAPGEGVRPVGDAYNPSSATGPEATALSLQQSALWAISACAEDPKIRTNLQFDEDDTLKKVLPRFFVKVNILSFRFADGV